jgi:transposase
MIDSLDREIAACERGLRRIGAEHRYVPLMTTIPGIARVLGYTIAAETGEICRFASPRKLTGYTGLCPAGPGSPVREPVAARAAPAGLILRVED